MISLEDYNAIEETLYLTKNPKNHARLLQSIDNVKRGEVKRRNLL